MSFWYRAPAAVVLMTAMTMSSVVFAEPPRKTLTNATGDQGTISLFEDTFQLYFSASLIKSTESNGVVVPSISYNYFNYETGDSRNGYCTVPADRILGKVTAGKGQISLKTISTDTLVVGVNCEFKYGGDLTVNIDWMSDGIIKTTSDVFSLIERKFPNGPHFSERGKGKFLTLSANVQLSIIGAGIGTVNETIPGGGSLSSFTEVSKTIEATPGAR